jgi:hypothetical protein
MLNLVAAEVQLEQVDATVESREVLNEAVREVADAESRAGQQGHVVDGLDARSGERDTQDVLERAAP